MGPLDDGSFAVLLAREAGLGREEAFGDWHLPGHLDSHEAADEALATA